MSTTATGSKVKDLVVTAAVASVVSAVVAPWVRQWLGGMGLDASPVPPKEAPPAPPPDDFNERIERLLEVPQPITQRAVAAVTGRRSRPSKPKEHPHDVQVQDADDR